MAEKYCTAHDWYYTGHCPLCQHERDQVERAADKDRQIANLTARLDEATRLLRYQEERNHSLNERLNEAEDRLERLLGEL